MRRVLVCVALAVASGCAGRYQPPTMRVVRRDELPTGAGVRIVNQGARSHVAKATRNALERSGFKVAVRQEDTATFVARLSADCRGRLLTRCTHYGLRFVNPATTEIVGDVTMNPIGGANARLGTILDTLVVRLKRQQPVQ